MNPIVLILAAGYGYLAGNPKARKEFFGAVNGLIGKGVDALNNIGGDGDVSKADSDAQAE